MRTIAEINNFKIGDNEHLFLDETKLENVVMYELHHSGGDMAELTVTMAVTVNQVGSE